MKSVVNLMPWNVRRASLVRRRAVQWGAVWALASIAALALAGTRYVSRDDPAHLRLAAAQRQQDRLARSEERLAGARGRLAALHAEEAILRSPLEQVPGLVILGIVSRCARQVEGALQVEKLSLSKTELPSGTQEASPDMDRRELRRVTLEGVARDNLTVAAFTSNLRDAGLFTAVERKSSGAQHDEVHQPVSYLIECSF